MLRVFFAACVLGALGATVAQAKDYRCVLETWKGTKNHNVDIAKSWTGDGFQVRLTSGAKNAKLRRTWDGKAEKWQDVLVTSNSKFHTLKFYQRNQVLEGWTIKADNTFSFRIYMSGECRAMVMTNGFRPIDAKGHLK